MKCVCLTYTVCLQAYMFQYDSTHGPWKHSEVKVDNGQLCIGAMRITVSHE